ncbi:MAG: 5-(carboxyamino)imidazole ribonucleotide mutase [Phycisphaerae bacterium]|nr:5-(carboxyamino)imidazole ribonucleotide mutase [Phycisphaerae bacterium]
MSDGPAPTDVLILMGSDSDWEAMSRCHDLLGELGIAHEVHVASAHRTPQKVHRLAGECAGRGVKVVIAAAGMAAHLAGTLAALVECPVIGVPMKGGIMDGLDALLSTVQMPPGVPVATVGVGSPGARNAAILAAQIIAGSDSAVAATLRDWRAKQGDVVEEKDRKLRASIRK